MRKFFGILSAVLCLTFSAQAYQLTAKVDSPVVALGQPLTLTITADDNVSETPDLSALQQNFHVYSTSVSRQTTYNNGQKSASTTWHIGLTPLNAGKQEIPAVKIGDESTLPLSLEVSTDAQPAGSGANVQTDEVFTIDGHLLNTGNKFYVQQQILYNVIVTDDGTLQSGEPVFQTTADTWMVKSLGDPEIASVNHQGRRLRMITFKYALFPQKSGLMSIPAVTFRGQALSSDLSPSGFDPFGNGLFNINVNLSGIFNVSKPVNLFFPAQKIEILPVPSDFRGQWWLPAENVRLISDWTENNTYKVGDAMTREIIMQADGVTESQLPEIKFSASPDWKQYPQKPLRQEKAQNNGLLSVQKINVIYIPQKSGSLNLPEISVNWFNVKTGKMETAVIAPETINIAPANNQPEMAETLEIVDQPQTQPISEAVSKKSKTYAPWLWILPAFVLGALVSWLAFRPIRRKDVKPECETRRYPDFIIQKAYQNDYRSLRDALVSWAVGRYPEHSVNNLKDVAQAAADPDFEKQIDLLLSKLYQANSSEVWNAKIFVDAFQKVARQKKKKQNHPPLPPLYD